MLWGMRMTEQQGLIDDLTRAISQMDGIGVSEDQLREVITSVICPEPDDEDEDLWSLDLAIDHARKRAHQQTTSQLTYERKPRR